MESDNTLQIPENLLNQLYEHSGNGDSLKGVIVVMMDEKGNPYVTTKSSAAIVAMGLVNYLRAFVKTDDDILAAQMMEDSVWGDEGFDGDGDDEEE